MKWADKTVRRTNTFPPHILFIMSEKRWGGGRGQLRSFNYCLPSQANIPACQGPFWLRFGQGSSDGPHFLLNRTRRRLQKWWHLIRWPGGEGNIKTEPPSQRHAPPHLPQHGASVSGEPAHSLAPAMVVLMGENCNDSAIWEFQVYCTSKSSDLI